MTNGGEKDDTYNDNDEQRNETDDSVPSARNVNDYYVVVVAMVYGVSCLYRIMNALWIETQFDPDEYWQTLEPAYCMVFGSGNTNNGNGDSNEDTTSIARDCAYTWEWTRSDVVGNNNHGTTTTRLLGDNVHSHPVRSYSSILFTLIWYGFLQWCHLDTSWMVSRGPLVVNACLVAAPTDTAVFCMSQQLMMRYSSHRHDDNNNKNKSLRSCLFGRKSAYCWWPYLCCVTNWFHGYALVRTYSNSVETMLLAVGLALLGPYLLVSSPITTRSTTSLARAKLAFVLGGWSVAIRFTSLSAWIPMGLLLACQQQTQEHLVHYYLKETTKVCWKKRRGVRLWEFGGCVCKVPALFGGLGLGLAMILDRYCFGMGCWVIPAWGSFEFNVLQGNGALYGTHPWHWYATAGLPAILGALLPLLFYSIMIGRRSRRQHDNVEQTSEWSMGERNIGWICILYVVTHSCSSHKEFRFIMPILPLLCCLAGRSIMDIIVTTHDRPPNPSTTTTTTTTTATSTVTTSPRWYDKKKNRSIHHGWGFLVVLLVGNYPQLLFLARFHQRAPIAINRHIVSLILQQPQRINDDTPEPSSSLQGQPQQDAYRIHYLMGCHSTPLYSHLHIPGVAVEAWTLDCSPKCRADPTLQCESDAFSMDPLAFVKMTYPHDTMGDTDAGLQYETTCPHGPPPPDDSDRSTVHAECSSIVRKPTKDVPDFLAAFQMEAQQMAPFLESQMGLVPIVQFRHAIRHVRLITSSSSHNNDEDASTTKKLIDTDILQIPLPFVSDHAKVEIEFDSMVLFAPSTHDA